MKTVELDPRLFLHPQVFGLSDGAFRGLIEALCHIATYDSVDFVPTRFVKPRVARELLESGLLTQDGAVYRVAPNVLEWGDESGDLPRIGHIGSKAVEVRSTTTTKLVVQDKQLGAFERFWTAFSLKTGRKDALRAWMKAIQKTDPEVIIEAAAAYRNWLENHPNPPAQKYAQGWLNARRWEDELAPYPNTNGRKVGPGGILMQQAAEMRERGE